MNIKDFKWTEKRFGTCFANILKRIAGDAEEAGREIEKFFKPTNTGEIDFEDSHGNNHTIVTASALENENSDVQTSLATALINRMEDEAVKEALNNAIDRNNAHKVTWQELKDKRDNGQLIAGSLYRITDYNCTTTQENTKSAGHQFDIVLLALSANKLAEEGWAMMNESNVYDVTFSDGVTKKWYIYLAFKAQQEGDVDYYNFVDASTLLGLEEVEDSMFSIDEENKTATATFPSTELTKENVTYNYFQNSNLSAWKVWYCLDNDTSRFAWADDGEGPTIIIQNSPYSRKADEDTNDYFAWWSEEEGILYTTTPNPSVGDATYDDTFAYNTVITAVSGFGRGVIYRLIDEWNNDCPYDFKNIQLYLPIVEGEYVSAGEKTWVYTFCLYNTDEGTYEDGSLRRIEVSVDDTYVVSHDNIMTANMAVSRYFKIPFNLAIGYYTMEDESGSSPSNCGFYGCEYATIQATSNAYLYYCNVTDFVVRSPRIYYFTKEVLTET